MEFCEYGCVRRPLRHILQGLADQSLLTLCHSGNEVLITLEYEPAADPAHRSAQFDKYDHIFGVPQILP